VRFVPSQLSPKGDKIRIGCTVASLHSFSEKVGDFLIELRARFRHHQTVDSEDAVPWQFGFFRGQVDVL